MDNSRLEEKFDKIKAEAKEEVAKEDSIKVFSLGELLNMEFKESQWTIEKLVPREEITIISGAPASFKTWMILQMAISISKGEPLFGQFESNGTGVLMIDEENHRRILKDRMKLLGAPNSLPIYFLSQKGFLVTDEKQVEKILKICEEKSVDVIFIDSLIRISNAEENDATEMSKVFYQIKKLCQAGKTVIVTHHERKEGINKSTAQNRMRGSSDISASVDSHIALIRDRKNKKKVKVEHAKLRCEQENEPFEIAFEKEEEKMAIKYLGSVEEEKTKEESAKEMIPEILRDYPEGLSREEIKQKVRSEKLIGDKSIKNAIDSLIESGEVNERAGEKNTKICTLSDNPDS